MGCDNNSPALTKAETLLEVPAVAIKNDTRECSKCGEAKASDQFRPRHKQCRTCHDAYKKAWYEANKERLLAKQKAKRNDPNRRAANKAYHHAYYQRNKVAILARVRAFTDERRDEINAKRRKGPRVKVPIEIQRANRTAWERKWRKEYPEKARVRGRRYAKNHPDIKLAATKRRQARVRNAPVSDLTAKQWREIVATFNGHCAYCTKLTDDLTQDHVIPVSRQGEHTASNVVPACRSCNSQKKDKTLLEYVMALALT
jgi:5-methylcytosine-specific restriction endonuclease McrA